MTENYAKQKIQNNKPNYFSSKNMKNCEMSFTNKLL